MANNKNVDYVLTKKPKGLTITRNGAKVTFEWKIADKNHGAGQIIEYNYTGVKKDIKVEPGVKKTSYTITIPTSNFFPNKANNKFKGTLQLISFIVSGRRKSYTENRTENKKQVKYTIIPAWNHSDHKDAIVKPPNNPSVTATLDAANRTTFKWTVAEAGNSSWKWFTQVRYQSVKVYNTLASSGASVSWSGAAEVVSASSDSSKYYDEPSLDGSFVRWFRIRAEGAGGYTPWVYSKHIYSRPRKAKIYQRTQFTEAKLNTAGGVDIKVTWEVDGTGIQPIDSSTVEYAIDTPLAGLTPKAGLQWKELATIKDTANSNAVSGTIDDRPQINECLWVRVVSYHDDRPTESDPWMILAGGLSAPTDLEPDINYTTYRGTVSADNTASEIPDSFLVVRFTNNANPEGIDIGIIENGQSTSDIIQFPAWADDDLPSFSVYAAVGSYEAKQREDGVTSYAITARMRSSIVTDGGTVPMPPTGITVQKTQIPGTVQVTWNWSWAEADSCELSWSSDPMAWESTNEPSTYVVKGTYASQWNIAGLATGRVWYIRARLINTKGDREVYGDYSDISAGTINLSSAPAIPVLTLSKDVVTVNDSLTGSWGYSTTDGTLQAYADLAYVTTEEGELVYHTIAHTETEQHATVLISQLVEQFGWETGETYGLAVMVVSASGHQADAWSNIEYVKLAEPITAEFDEYSLEELTIPDDDGDERTALCLTHMPMTVTITGAGADGTTILAIERLEPYDIDRPDESIVDETGYAGETIYLHEQQGEDQIEIALDNKIIGRLDDGAQYRLWATIKDVLGQTDKKSIDFEVRWQNKATTPDARVIIDEANSVAILTPLAVEGMAQTDTCDIYRLSADKPKLIYEDAEFGEKYVDPYPTIGDHGGYRFVCKTENGDYITEDGGYAWFDHTDSYLDLDYNVINFENSRVELSRNIDLSSSWEKDFQETRYLGGSIQGDWNASVLRESDIGAVALTLTDKEEINSMRRLAEYPGVCHVRTIDGSNYTADIQVSEDRDHGTGNMVVSFSLKVTRVDSDVLDVMTYEEYES